MTITGSNTTNFGFQKLGSNDSAGYSTINEVVDGIDTILNASDRLIKAAQTPTVAYVITGDGVDWVAGLVVTNSITNLAVTTGKIDELAVTTGKIAANAVTLGAKTSGDYVATVAGTASQIASSAASSGVGTTHTLSLVSGATLPGAPTVATAVGSYPQSSTTARVSTVQYVNDAVANVNASGSVALSGDVGGTAGATVIGGNKVTNAMLATALQAFLVPTGTVSAFAGSSAPTGYLLCDGTPVSRSTYAALWTALGTTSSPYGQGDGSTTFNTPDLKGRTIIGVGTGTELTAALGVTPAGMAASVTLSAAQSGVPAHTHPINASATTDGAGAHTHSVGHTDQVYQGTGPGVWPPGNNGVNGYGGGNQGHSVSTDGAHNHTIPANTAQANTTAAAASAHTNIQPSLPLNYIIKV